MSIISFLRTKRVLPHFIFWLVYLSFYTIQSGFYLGDYVPTLIRYLYILPVLLAATYFTNYYIVPKYLLQKKYLEFVFLFLFSALFFILLLKLIFWHFIATFFYMGQGLVNYYKAGFFYPTYLMSHAITIYSIVFLFGFVKLTKQWFISNKIKEELEKEKRDAELRFLKAQMNPHFLFNVLNSLFALSIKNSDRTSDMILKLSAMLDFVLYQSNTELILIEKELKLIDDYVELEKLRYGEKLKFNMDINGDTKNIRIAPLVLFPLVENAFKHGVSTNLISPYINIELSITSNNIIFIIENSKSENKKNGMHNEGIGLNNVKRRLELLYFNKSILNINDTANMFKIELNLIF